MPDEAAPGDTGPVDQGPAPGSDEFDPRKHYWDGKEWWTLDRMQWWDGARWQPWDAPHVSGLAEHAGPGTALPRIRADPIHVRDFWLAFTAWLVVNGVLVFAIAAQPSDAQQSLGAWLFVANVGVLIALAFVRRYAALGILTAFGTAFAVVALGGIFFTAGDFAAAGTGGLGGAVFVWIVGAVLIPVGVFFTLRAIHRSLR